MEIHPRRNDADALDLGYDSTTAQLQPLISEAGAGAMRAPLPTAGLRPRVQGKFLYLGSEKLYIRGVTYGAFRPDKEGREYTDFAQIDRDFAQMAASGFNAVRIPHTTPPRAVLDI